MNRTASEAEPRRWPVASWVMGALALFALALPERAGAVYLDDARNVALRARAYTEASIATESSDPQTVTKINQGEVISHRNFFNPELDANVPQYASFLGLDELKFRFALWGFYDGIYDYLDPKWRNQAENIKARFTRGHTSSAPFFPRNDNPRNFGKIYAYQPDPTLGHDHNTFNQPFGDTADVPFRINEAYVSLMKGPVSLRLGRQSISWGESDTIALLDQSNPFDVTRSLPGIFQDVDEARIPLWTARGQLQLFDSWGPFSSGFLDAYLVPGSIDTTTGETPVPGGVSPYGPPEGDPQELVDGFLSFLPPDIQPLINGVLGGIQFTQYDRQPSRNMANSRYGIRLESIINKDYTASLYFYRTFAQIPVPRFKRLDLTRTALARSYPAGTPPCFSDPPGPDCIGPAQIITETSHGLTNVFGSSLSFYSALLNGVVRLNVQYFLGEPGFIPNKNLPFEALIKNPRLKPVLEPLGIDLEPGPYQGFIPKADYLRWEIGFDRFFFNRVLNPANSFVWVTGLVFSWNIDETLSGRDYRYYGQRKVTGDPDNPWKVGVNTEELEGIDDVANLKTVKQDYVDLFPLECFFQSTLQTDYFHGRLQPRLTGIINPRGTFVVAPRIDFRFSDRMLFTLRYAAIDGGFFGTGFFRDRDQLAMRVTFLLN